MLNYLSKVNRWKLLFNNLFLKLRKMRIKINALIILSVEDYNELFYEIIIK